MISKKQLLKLADTHESLCVSIYIPTHRAGQQTLDGTDKISLKNQLKEVRQQLAHSGRSDEEIKTFLEPVIQLLDNSEFWRKQSDGLAIFLTEQDFYQYSIPIPFKEFSYVSNEFYLKPLLPLIESDTTFYLLKLKMDEVKLYECSRFSIREIDIKDHVPSQLEDRVGYDYKEQGMQFRSGQGNQGNGIFHGHEDLSSEKKEELYRFFRAVDEGILSLIREDQHPPLVLACQDFHFPIYREACKYLNLCEQFVSGNPENSDVLLLHEKACDILEPYFQRDQREHLKKFSDTLHMGKSSTSIKEILPAIIDGKVEALFLAQDAEKYGIYHSEHRETIIRSEEDEASVSLLNLAAVKVLEQGGHVYLLERNDMPESMGEINALYRY